MAVRSSNPAGVAAPGKRAGRLELHNDRKDPQFRRWLRELQRAVILYVWTGVIWRGWRCAWRNRDVTAMCLVMAVGLFCGLGYMMVALIPGVCGAAAWTKKCSAKRAVRREQRRLDRVVIHAPKVLESHDRYSEPEGDPIPRRRAGHPGPLWRALDWCIDKADEWSPLDGPRHRIATYNELRLPGLVKPEEFDRLQSTIASSYGEVVKITRHAAHPGRATMRIQHLDWLARPAPWVADPKATPSNLPLGYDWDARLLRGALWTKHGAEPWLVVGVNGSGKSAFISGILARLVFMEAVELYLCDPAGTDYGPYYDLATEVATTPKACVDLALHFEDLRAGRQIELGGDRSVRKAMWPDWTLRVLVVDEAASLTVKGAPRNEEILRALHSIGSQGRKAAHTMILATQHPSVDVVPSLIRNEIHNVLGLRVNRPEQNAVFFGQGIRRANDIDLSTIDKAHRGRGVWTDGSSYTPVRTFGLFDTVGIPGNPHGNPLVNPGNPVWESPGIPTEPPSPVPPSIVVGGPASPEQAFQAVLSRAPAEGLTVAEIHGATVELGKPVPVNTLYRWVKGANVQEVGSVQPKRYRLKLRSVV